MQSVIGQDEEEKSDFDYNSSTWYNTDDALLKGGKKAYISTVYFVDTSIICGEGREKEDFDFSGTGEVLWIQKKGDRDQVYVAPLTEDEAEEKVKCMCISLFIYTYLGNKVKTK